MPDLSYLITYRNTDSARKRNLHYLLASLATRTDIEVILVEQDTNPCHKASDLPGTCNYLFAYNPGQFNKSWGLNLAAGLATTHKLVFADADMLLNEESFEQIIMAFKAGADAINPYSQLINLDADESQMLINGASGLNLKRAPSQMNRHDLNQYPPFCGGVFAVSKHLYLETGGMDERFSGWGAEDDAMSMKLAHFAKHSFSVDGQCAYHLWHPPASNALLLQPAYLSNLARLTAYHEYGLPFYNDLARTDSQYIANREKFATAATGHQVADTAPLVSCLCVTRERVEALKQTIECYHQQSYAQRELIILCENDDPQTIEFLRSFDDPDIHVHIVPRAPRLTLGELRNRAMSAANGDYICQWDDDDWYHPRRLELQLKAAQSQNKAASILPRWLIYSREEHKAYCSNVRLWEGSLLCQKSILQSGPGYPALSKGEDTAVISWLYIQDELAIEDHPDLYVYIHSGNNTWEDQHFQKILDSSIPLEQKDSDHLRNLLKLS